MNILLIGNGFDLAHKLPTTYKDFLAFVALMKDVCNSSNPINRQDDIQKSKIHDQLKQHLLDTIQSDDQTWHEQKDLWHSVLMDNFWINHFNSNDILKKSGWIDFEQEISAVIQEIDNNLLNSGKMISFEYQAYGLPLSVASFFSDREYTYREIRDKLLNDLNNLIIALELYLKYYIEPMACNYLSPDILEIQELFSHAQTTDNKVLSFNYTHTFSRIYGKNLDVDYDYIHGKISSTPNNMVLGIDDYLPNDRKNKDVEFIAFKKYYQRIWKETGNKYRLWIDSIHAQVDSISDKINDAEKELSNMLSGSPVRMGKLAQIDHLKSVRNAIKHNLFIFGHSLDVTDHDVLQSLILCNSIKTTIFYKDRDSFGQQIANLVKVIGQDELIARTGGCEKTIIFRQQQAMVPINNCK